MSLVRYRKREELDAGLWDACVAASCQRKVYAFSWYLDAITEHWGGLVLEEGGVYQAVMPVPYRRRYGFRYVQMPDYCQQLGLFTRPGLDQREWLPRFWRAFRQAFGRVVSYRFNEENEPDLHLFGKAMRIRHCENLLLPLHKPYPDLQAQYASGRRTNLSRAKNAGWQLETVADVRPLIHLHRRYNEAKATQAYQRLDLRIYERFARAVDEAYRRGKVQIWMANREGSPEAGCVFIRDGNRLVYLFNGASERGRKQQARLLILDQLIRTHAGTNLELDWECPVAGAESVRAYYRSFGAEGRGYREVGYGLGVKVHCLRLLRPNLKRSGEATLNNKL